MVERSTIYEVARRSGVSTATVSRVMHDGQGFSEQTRERVLAAAEELGWVPNSAARSLAVRRAGIIGLLFPDLGIQSDLEAESPLYLDQVIRGAERAATRAGDGILIAATRGAAGLDLAWSVAGKVDGLVVLAGSLSRNDLAAITRSVPVVLLATSADGHHDFVAADNRGGAREITRHLLTDHGYTDLAFIAGPARSPDSNERFAGYQEALAEAGLPVPRRPDARGGFTAEGGRRAMRQLLVARSEPPRAVVLGNDEMAVAAQAVLAEHGLRVPDQVAVTGFDDITLARHITPGLSTVRQPMRESGERAVEMLLDRVADPTGPPRRLMLPTEVVLRRSCGCWPSTGTSTRPPPAPGPVHQRPTPPKGLND